MNLPSKIKNAPIKAVVSGSVKAARVVNQALGNEEVPLASDVVTLKLDLLKKINGANPDPRFTQFFAPAQRTEMLQELINENMRELQELEKTVPISLRTPQTQGSNTDYLRPIDYNQPQQ